MRLVLILLASLFPALAIAKVPVPKPKPTAASFDPAEAFAKLVADGTATAPTLTAYAPAAVAPAQRLGRAPAERRAVALYLVAKLSDAGEPVSNGMVWRVFREIPDETGKLPLVAKGEGGDMDVRLRPGRYIVHAAYGRAARSRTVTLSGAVNTETFVMQAGGLQLDAVVKSPVAAPATPSLFEIYDTNVGATLVGRVRAGEIARLPAGSYRVVSRIGGVNAVRRADVTVTAGKLTQVKLHHKAGTVRLRLMRDATGEALANTAWRVVTDEGDAVYEHVGAHANVTLQAGRYGVVARHGEVEYSRTFTVRSGDDADVIVLADTLN